MLRHGWTKEEVAELFEKPFVELVYQAQSVHRQHFKPNQIQACAILNVKTGACPEDCGYCSQSGHHNTELKKEPLMNIEEIKEAAQKAKESGATRFCLAAAWRSPPEKDLPKVIEMIKVVKEAGLETCVTLGLLSKEQTEELEEAGLDYYNHNIDTSPEYYPTIIKTRTFQDRLDTIEHVRNSKIKVCCGGILGMGESRDDRISFLLQLANLPKHPESVPINQLVKIPGTPLADQKAIDAIEFIRTVACARILMPTSFVRLSAGRLVMSDETQALCFLAGANSIHFGEKLLTTKNNDVERDVQLFKKLGVELMEMSDLHAS